MERLFDFADERKWPTDSLLIRLDYLGDHKQNKLSKRRYAAISREMAHIAFEFDARSSEIKEFDSEFDNYVPEE